MPQRLVEHGIITRGELNVLEHLGFHTFGPNKVGKFKKVVILDSKSKDPLEKYSTEWTSSERILKAKPTEISNLLKHGAVKTVRDGKRTLVVLAENDDFSKNVDAIFAELGLKLPNYRALSKNPHYGSI